MTTRDLQAQLQELHGVEVSPGLIFNVTDAVEEERKLWQNRPLDALYPIVYFDVIVAKVRTCGASNQQSDSPRLGCEFIRYKRTARDVDDPCRSLPFGCQY